MARPLKKGIDYFPFDVDFLSDKKIKLIKGEFGVKGVLIVVQLLCTIYKESGYFATCDSDDCILVADAVGCGCDAKTISEVVQGCVRRSIFDEGVWDAFGVLTSRGIQRRYLKAIGTREHINIIEEYWLLDINDKTDVPASISKKCVFKSINSKETIVNFKETTDNSQKNPQKESKEKESKVEDTAPNDISSTLRTIEMYGFMMDKHNEEEFTNMIINYGSEWTIEAVKRSLSRGKKNTGYIKGILNNWKAAGGMDDGKGKQEKEAISPSYRKYIPEPERKAEQMPEDMRRRLFGG